MRQILLPVALLASLAVVSCDSGGPVSSSSVGLPGSPASRSPAPSDVSAPPPIARSAGHTIVGSILGLSLEQGLDPNRDGVLAQVMVLVSGTDDIPSTGADVETARSDEKLGTGPDALGAGSDDNLFTGARSTVKLLIVTSDTQIKVRHNDVVGTATLTSLEGGKVIDALYTNGAGDDDPLAGFSRALEIVISD